jgi:demethylmenaquinone methyltransferase/2-methoxy-6-polyprenyl-1,4-benzoquinol methylase
MFGRIAPSYDKVNMLMALGRDSAWRRRAARAASLPPRGIALDVGTGTGELARELATLAPDAHVVGLDYTPAMLARAPARMRRHSAGLAVSWLIGDGQRLPFADGSFDAVTSAFVLRNLTDLDQAFAEMARVTRPGGRVVALEISPTVAPAARPFFDLYFRRLVPLLGGAISGDRTAYTYLPASVAGFPVPSAIAGIMRRAGLVPLPASRLMLGSVFIHVGLRIAGIRHGATTIRRSPRAAVEPAPSGRDLPPSGSPATAPDVCRDAVQLALPLGSGADRAAP